MALENLDRIAEDIEREMDEKDTLREIALKSCRAIIRLSGAAIRSMHKKEDPTALLGEARDEASKLKGLLSDHPDLYHSGFVNDSLQELAEAFLLQSIMDEKPLPTPKSIDVPSGPYLLGLGDVIGELRRSALDALREGDVDTAEKRLNQMEEIYDVLLMFDYPSALLSIRRKQDVARALIEKTRGEVSVAQRTLSLEKKLDEKMGKR